MRFVIPFLLLLAISSSFATNIHKWALLVAGSNGYYNYRHQADICHAYHILRENGYPDSNIIVMMYDDIAHNPNNPYPGVIINSPDGSNVYRGVPKDYIRHNVTHHNFLAVLSGNMSAATGRVIPANPENDIFVYFADHGGPGLIAFPRGVLYAHQLIDTLAHMYINNSYNSIVFYMEACESGSMFNMLLSPLMNIYAVTASTPDQSSWAAYCDNNLNTCLGDVFSVNFLQNSDSFEAIVNETLYRQFKIVQQETNTSNVCVYGDLTIQQRNVSHYFVFKNTTRHANNSIVSKSPVTSVVDTRNYKIDYLIKQYTNANSVQKQEIMEDLRQEIYQDVLLEKLYGKQIKTKASTNPCYPTEYIDTKCVEQKVEAFRQEHGHLSESFFKYIRPMCSECITNYQ